MSNFLLLVVLLSIFQDLVLLLVSSHFISFNFQPDGQTRFGGGLLRCQQGHGLLQRKHG
jgi:hypothetical protein